MNRLCATLIAVASIACLELEPELEPGSDRSEIIGGTQADLEDEAWVAQLWNRLPLWPDFLTCTGSLITPDWVLTAAHCVDRIDYVKLAGVRHELAEKIPHPHYNDELNDIGLLRLAEPAVGVEPMPLNLDLAFPTVYPYNEATADLANVTVFGWGETSEGGDAPDRLLRVDLTAVDEASCQEIWYLSDVAPSHLCVGVVGGGQGACSGDSGSPVVSDGLTGRIQVGVYHAGGYCGGDHPGVAARVAWYRDFILEHVPEAETRSPAALAVSSYL